MKGSTHRRCYCRDPRTGKPVGKNCLKLSSRDPKTDAGARTIALDADTVEVLRRHRARQDEEREKWGTA
ncbi:hypothetical protein [Streptomyces sp. NPDC005805]|uniref:hypothetical protein n=1 Tax=Streptomyces sp. NPDC005805 TaxID=3157068 RepID=UPI0033C352BB